MTHVINKSIYLSISIYVQTYFPSVHANIAFLGKTTLGEIYFTFTVKISVYKKKTDHA